MGKVLMFGIAFVVVLYAFIDVLSSRGNDVRTLPKGLWAVLVIVLPVVGAIGWFALGRPLRAGGDGARPRGRGRGPVAPDDDPAFLRSIDDVTWSQRMRDRREKRDGGAPTGGDPAPDV